MIMKYILKSILLSTLCFEKRIQNLSHHVRCTAFLCPKFGPSSSCPVFSQQSDFKYVTYTSGLCMFSSLCKYKNLYKSLFTNKCSKTKSNNTKHTVESNNRV